MDGNFCRSFRYHLLAFILKIKISFLKMIRMDIGVWQWWLHFPEGFNCSAHAISDINHSSEIGIMGWPAEIGFVKLHVLIFLAIIMKARSVLLKKKKKKFQTLTAKSCPWKEATFQRRNFILKHCPTFSVLVVLYLQDCSYDTGWIFFFF